MNQILHHVNSLIYTPKNWQSSSITFKSHSMDLDHRRLIRPEKKSGRFLRSTSLLYKNLPANLGLCKPTFYTIYSITPEVKQYYEALFLSYRPWTESSISHQDDRSTRGLLAKPLKKFPKSPIRPAGSHFCSASCGRVFE